MGRLTHFVGSEASAKSQLAATGLEEKMITMTPEVAQAAMNPIMRNTSIRNVRSWETWR